MSPNLYWLLHGYQNLHKDILFKDPCAIVKSIQVF